jgi:acetyl-CoA C-acetyltransferase
MPRWYAENGQYLTTKFFGMKANRYLHDHGISPATLAKVAAKNFRNGALNPNAFRRKPIPEDEILSSPMLNYPLTQYMFCAPDEGAAAVNTTFAPVVEDVAPTVYAARAAFEKAGVAPQDVDVIQLQDTDSGAEMPVNTDGGLIANGEPIGASGLRQIHELVRQLRGEADDRQVPGDPRVGFAQLYGAPGTAAATVVTL